MRRVERHARFCGQIRDCSSTATITSGSTWLMTIIELYTVSDHFIAIFSSFILCARRKQSGIATVNPITFDAELLSVNQWNFYSPVDFYLASISVAGPLEYLYASKSFLSSRKLIREVKAQTRSKYRRCDAPGELSRSCHLAHTFRVREISRSRCLIARLTRRQANLPIDRITRMAYLRFPRIAP